MPMNDDELLAAVSSAVDGSAPAATETPPQETNTNENADTDTGADDAAGDDAGAGSDASGGADADAGDEAADEAADGEEGKEADAATGEDEPELGADGKPVAKSTEPKVGDLNPATGKPFTAEEIAAKKAEAEKAEFRKNQVEDPINAPIPKYLKETTQKRMTKLVDIAKDLTGKVTALQSDRDMIVGQIVDTGATAAQYSQALAYLKMVNSRDPEHIKQAIGVMQAELSALSRMAGVVVPGVDLLANHADLKAAVEAKQITKELAEEIAAGREQRAVQTQNSRAVQETEQQTQQAHVAGVQALNNIGKQLAKADPAGYKARAQAVLAQIGDQMRSQHPSQWAQTFLVAYTTYKTPARQPAAPAARKPPVVPRNQPLRGNNPSGGQQKAPGSLEDAINMGIAAGTRR